MSCMAPITGSTAANSSTDLQPKPMTRCECSGVSFSQVAERMTRDGLSLEDAMRRTDCGRNCTACVPDLKRFLNGRQ